MLGDIEALCVAYARGVGEVLSVECLSVDAVLDPLVRQIIASCKAED